MREHWPFDDVWELTDQILRDGKVDESERWVLQAFCERFLECDSGQSLGDDEFYATKHMQTTAPVLLTLEGVCTPDPTFDLKVCNIVFTGKARLGKRAEREETAKMPMRAYNNASATTQTISSSGTSAHRSGSTRATAEDRVGVAEPEEGEEDADCAGGAVLGGAAGS